MDCPICFETFAENKYEINCGSKLKHVICNSCESTLRLTTRPEYRVRKGETKRQIKCPLCRGVEKIENPRSAESYKAELESLYVLLNPATRTNQQARAYVAPSLEQIQFSRLEREHLRQAAFAARDARLERDHQRQVLRQSVTVAAAPAAAPAAVPATAVAAPAVLALDTGTQAIWCIYKRNGIACPTKSKTKRKCFTRVAVGVYCQEKVCRACNKCAWH